MLVISRHRDEQILIGEDIVITILEVRGDQVRLGIKAPIDVDVDRPEYRRERAARLEKSEGEHKTR